MEENKLLIEIHQMLCKICNYIDKVESPEYLELKDKRAFNINVAADMYVDKLNQLKDDILNRKL